MLKKTIIALFGFGVSIVTIIMLAKHIDLKESWQHIAKMPLWILPLLAAIYVSSFFLRAYRWILMVENHNKMTFTANLHSVVVGFAGNNFLPARGGEFLRMEYYSRKSGVSRLSALTSVLTERILDGLSLFLVLMVTLFASKRLLDVSWLKSLSITAGILFGLLTIALVLAKTHSKWIQGIINIPGGKTTAVLSNIYEKILHALSFLNADKKTLKILLSSIGIWIIEGLVYIITLSFFFPSINIIVAGYLCLSVVNFGLLVPSSPGYIGVFQAMTVLALSIFNVPSEIALSISLVVHAMMFIPITLWGIIILVSNSISIIKKRSVDSSLA